VSPAFRHPFQCRQPEVVAPVHQALVGLTQMRGVLAYPDFIGNDTAAIASLRQKPGMVEGRLGTGCVAIPTDSRVGNKLVTLLSIASPNVVQRKTLPWPSAVPFITWTAFAFGYHSGHLVASMMCCQTRSQGAWMTSSLCANRSAFAGSNPVGQEYRASGSRDRLSWSWWSSFQLEHRLVRSGSGPIQIRAALRQRR
jgi:hypothetical protein